VNSIARRSSIRKTDSRRYFSSVGRGAQLVALAGALALSCVLPAAAQTQPAAQNSDAKQQAGAGQSAANAPPTAQQQTPGTISGTVTDPSGAAVVGATVKLSRDGQALATDANSGDDGQFSFKNISPGPYQITISANGFTTKTYSGTLNAGEASLVPPMTLEIAGTVTKVTVEPPMPRRSGAITR